jgi:hypothetical protein
MLRDMPTRLRLYGLAAEFATPEELVEAAAAAHSDGYQDIDAFSPMPFLGVRSATVCSTT